MGGSWTRREPQRHGRCRGGSHSRIAPSGIRGRRCQGCDPPRAARHGAAGNQSALPPCAAAKLQRLGSRRSSRPRQPSPARGATWGCRPAAACTPMISSIERVRRACERDDPGGSQPARRVPAQSSGARGGARVPFLPWIVAPGHPRGTHRSRLLSEARLFRARRQHRADEGGGKGDQRGGRRPGLRMRTAPWAAPCHGPPVLTRLAGPCPVPYGRPPRGFVAWIRCSVSGACACAASAAAQPARTGPWLATHASWPRRTAMR
jgi:hypothetical protein